MKNSIRVTLFVIFFSLFCVACVRSSSTDSILETGSLSNVDNFSYELKQMHNGKILFSIKGKWSKDCYWMCDVKLQDDIFIHEDYVANDIVVYFVENISSKAGYTEIVLNLTEKETNIIKGKCVLLVSTDSSGNISIEQIWYTDGVEK